MDLDRFGQDPQVQALRKVFAAMEYFDLAASGLLGLDWTNPVKRQINRQALDGLGAELARPGTPAATESDWIEAYARAYGRAAARLGYQLDIKKALAATKAHGAQR